MSYADLKKMLTQEPAAVELRRRAIVALREWQQKYPEYKDTCKSIDRQISELLTPGKSDERAIRRGDIVTLLSGGPKMTVECECEAGIPRVTCVWYDQIGFQRAEIYPAALHKYYNQGDTE